MNPTTPAGSPWTRADAWRALALGLGLLCVFISSRVVFVSDSLFTAWLAERIVVQHALDLEPALLPGALHARDEPVIGVWHAATHDGKRYYGYPLLPVLLSIPPVRVANALGVSAQAPGLGVDQDAERRIQHAIAAPLMTLLGALFYAMARLRLPPLPAFALAVVGALGSSVYSTLSTALWSQTWAALLLGLLLLHVLRAWHGAARARPWLIGLLAWMVLACRPAGITALFGVALLIWPLGRVVVQRAALAFAVFAALGAAASMLVFGTPSPPTVYRAGQFAFDAPLAHVAGALLSPGRGLWVYSPWIALAILVALRYAHPMRAWWPAWCALAAFAAHVALLSVFGMWWGSWSYGPRLFAEHAPWFMVLAIEAWAVWRLRPPQPGGRVLGGAAVVAALLAIGIHGVGANSVAARHWTGHVHLDESGGREAWNWRYPQFAAPWLSSPHVPVAALRAGFPRELLRAGIDIAADDPRYAVLFADGWSGPQAGARAITAAHAQIVLRLQPRVAGCLQVDLRSDDGPAVVTLAIDDLAPAARVEVPAGGQSDVRIPFAADPGTGNRVLRLSREEAGIGPSLTRVRVLPVDACEDRGQSTVSVPETVL
jgi:hypothetical protein